MAAGEGREREGKRRAGIRARQTGLLVHLVLIRALRHRNKNSRRVISTDPRSNYRHALPYRRAIGADRRAQRRREAAGITQVTAGRAEAVGVGAGGALEAGAAAAKRLVPAGITQRAVDGARAVGEAAGLTLIAVGGAGQERHFARSARQALGLCVLIGVCAGRAGLARAAARQ